MIPRSVSVAGSAGQPMSDVVTEIACSSSFPPNQEGRFQLRVELCTQAFAHHQGKRIAVEENQHGRFK